MPKKTPDNCELIKRAVFFGLGEPEQRNGKCLGYGGSGDEPCEECQRCSYCESEDDNDA